MPSCKVDCTTSPTLCRLLRRLRKKYRHIEKDLMMVIPDIEGDYSISCQAARIPKRKLGIEHWKYQFGSTDLQRSPSNSFRVIGIFLEDEEPNKERTMYLSLAYFKGDKEDVTDEEVRNAVAELQQAMLQRELPGESEPDPNSN